MKAGQKPDPVHEHENIPGGAVLLEELTDTTEPEWETGTAVDLFNGVYRVMAQPTKKRRGFSPESITQIKRAYKTLYRNGLTLEEAKKELATQVDQHAEIGLLLEFLNTSTRGIVR